MKLTDLVDHVIGVDPDRDRITAAVVCVKTQGEIASKTFPATARGYGQALRWAETFTTQTRRAWSIESSGSYGAGLTAALVAKDEFVIEFDHPSSRPSKDGAKTDTLDAVRAARELLGRKAWATPRSRGTREGLRTLITARDSAKLARVAAINVLKATDPYDEHLALDFLNAFHGRYPTMDALIDEVIETHGWNDALDALYDQHPELQALLHIDRDGVADLIDMRFDVIDLGELYVFEK